MPLLSEFVETVGELYYKHFAPSELPASFRAKFLCTTRWVDWRHDQTRAHRGCGQAWCKIQVESCWVAARLHCITSVP